MFSEYWLLKARTTRKRFDHMILLQNSILMNHKLDQRYLNIVNKTEKKTGFIRGPKINYDFIEI